MTMRELAGKVLLLSAIPIAFTFRPSGLGVLFGLALFQVLLVLSTALPVWKKIRTGDDSDVVAAGSGTPDEAPKD